MLVVISIAAVLSVCDWATAARVLDQTLSELVRA